MRDNPDAVGPVTGDHGGVPIPSTTLRIDQMTLEAPPVDSLLRSATAAAVGSVVPADTTDTPVVINPTALEMLTGAASRIDSVHQLLVAPSRPSIGGRPLRDTAHYLALEAVESLRSAIAANTMVQEALDSTRGALIALEEAADLLHALPPTLAGPNEAATARFAAAAEMIRHAADIVANGPIVGPDA